MCISQSVYSCVCDEGLLPGVPDDDSLCLFLRLSACLCVSVCDSASVVLSDGVDVHLCSCDGFWAAISEQCQ